jgi:cytochrome oxidase Cu insertion factor (SCO1/SenC/PrrC family)
MHRHLFGIVGLILIGVAAAGYFSKRSAAPEAESKPLPELGQVPEFAFTERSGQPLTSGHLQDKVWVASFIFTCCTQACPQVSGSMAELQAAFANEPGFRLVSFSVDPRRDTPKVLSDYAQQFSAPAEQWLFVTGDQDQLYQLIEKSFHLAVHQNTGAARTPGNEVTHSSRLMLVDRRGQIRGYFEGRRVDDKGNPVSQLPELKERVRALLGERP